LTAQEVEAVAKRLESEGWFDRCRGGAQPACSYFALQVAYTCNPTGDPSLPGRLRKTAGGHNIEGYAEDAIALNGNPNDFHNVMDLVAGAGGDSASVRSANLNPRRPADVWEAPRPLTAQQLAILGKSGSNPVPVPTPTPTPTPAPVDLEPLKRRIASLEGLVGSLGTLIDNAGKALEERSAPSSLRSPDGRFTLEMQGDGNLVLYENGTAIWFTGTNR
jgi:hypothetical protein